MSKTRRPWPEKRRKAQAEICRRTKPERNATGPKTAAGKARSSQNALKHGLRSVEILKLRKLLRAQAIFIEQLTHSIPNIPTVTPNECEESNPPPTRKNASDDAAYDKKENPL